MYYRIYKITADPVVDYAAEELKRYLRMMMPRCGEIIISYDPEVKDGFRLGLMEAFGLDVSEAEVPDLDDIVHIDTDEEGGIIAGNNVRSVLLAVYKYLTINGCRWLFPGVDGEYIPIKGIEPVKYHKLADSRYRGYCNEGAESQQAMLETIEFAPKIGLNTNFCMSNPEGRKIMTDYAEANPHVTFLNVWLADYQHNHCECDVCRTKRICEDVISYRDNGFLGIIEDGSQRCFFPNGFSFYCYGQKLFDHSVTYEELEKDYFTHAYGDQWQLALDYLKAVDTYMPQTYTEAKHTSRIPNNFYNPAMEEKLLALVPIAKEFEAKLDEHKNMPARVQTVAMRLLKLHAEYVQGLAKAMALKSVGKDDEAKDAALSFFDEFGRHEVAIERYYDHMLMVHSMNVIFNTKSTMDQ